MTRDSSLYGPGRHALAERPPVGTVGLGRPAAITVLALIAVALVGGALTATPVAPAVAAAGVVGAVLAVRANRSDNLATVADSGVHLGTTSGLVVLYVLPALLLVTALDYGAFFRGQSQPRFALLVLPFVAYGGYLISIRDQPLPPPARSWIPFFVLTAYILVGSLIGKFALGTDNPAISIGLAACCGLPLVRLRMSDRQGSRLLWWVGTASLIYTLLNALAWTGYANFLTSDPPGNYRHEKAWVIALAFVALVMARRWTAALVCLVCTAYIFFQYAAATYLVVLVVASITVLSLRKPRVARRVVAVAGAMTVFAFVSVSVLGISWVQVTSEYFTSVGKQDNSSTRFLAIQLSWDKVTNSPIWGSFYTGGTSLPVPRFELGRDLLSIESHNDFLAAWMLGGLVALALLVSWIVMTNVEAHRALRAFAQAERRSHQRLIICSLVAFNSFWAVALFNPLLTQLSTAASCFAAYAVLHSLTIAARQPGAATVRDGRRKVIRVTAT